MGNRDTQNIREMRREGGNPPPPPRCPVARCPLLLCCKLHPRGDQARAAEPGRAAAQTGLLLRRSSASPAAPSPREQGRGRKTPGGRRADRCVPREGWGGRGARSGLRAGGPPALPPRRSASKPSLQTHAELQGKGGRRGGSSSPLRRRREGGDESRGFAQSVADTPACPLPRTSGEQAMGGREGGMGRGAQA